MGLRQFEQRLERLVEGAFAKTFRSDLRPVELGRRITREMDLHRTVGVSGLMSPNRFVVSLSPTDQAQFDSYSEALVRELGEAAREHARECDYAFIGPVHVELTVDESLGAGEFVVASEMVEAPGGALVGVLVLPDGRRVSVGEAVVGLGRRFDCDVVLADPNVSRRHAEVRRQGNGFVLEDLSSTNGTRLNGALVTSARLNDGDEIAVGATRIRFEAS
ncbi:MAG: FhaA domain-containing protein [Acidimicrobiales bacterium]